MMTVARRNRTWTTELTSQLLEDVNRVRLTEGSANGAFRALAPRWGVAPETLSGQYYKVMRRSADKGSTPSRAIRKATSAPAVNQPDSIAGAIALLKKMGATVTINF